MIQTLMYFALTDFYLSWKRIIATSAREWKSCFMSHSTTLLTYKDFTACSFSSVSFSSICFLTRADSKSQFSTTAESRLSFWGQTRNKLSYSVKTTTNLDHSCVLCLELPCDSDKIFHDIQKLVDFCPSFLPNMKLSRSSIIGFRSCSRMCAYLLKCYKPMTSVLYKFNRSIVGVLTKFCSAYKEAQIGHSAFDVIYC